MVNLLVWHLLPPVWWGLPWRCSALTVCVCVCMLCVCFSFSPDLSYMCWRVVYMTENVFHVENLCFCELTFLYFCVCACFFVLVGPVQGASGVWAHVRPVVGRPPGRLWQWKDPGVLWPQHGQRVLLFLQVQEGRITPQGVVTAKKTLRKSPDILFLNGNEYSMAALQQQIPVLMKLKGRAKSWPGTPTSQCGCNILGWWFTAETVLFKITTWKRKKFSLMSLTPGFLLDRSMSLSKWSERPVATVHEQRAMLTYKLEI